MNDISPALTRRLPAYFRALIRLYGNGKSRVSSEELARELHLVPSQVRTDMKALGCAGQRSYGYGIPSLYKRIADILQLSDKFTAVIVGSSHIAKAIAETPVFTKRGVKLAAVFADCGEPDGYEDCAILPECKRGTVGEFEGYFSENRPNIVILAGNIESSERVFEFLEDDAAKRISDGADITEVWNFTDSELVSKKMKVKNIHMSDYLMILCLEAGK